MCSCEKPSKNIKKDLEELKTALEKIDQGVEPISQKAEEVQRKILDAMPHYRTDSEEEKNNEEETAKNGKEEILSVKRPDTKEARKIIERLEKNISKVKAKNDTEVGYYYYLNNIIEETKKRLDNIDNFENFLEENGIQFLDFSISQSMRMKNIIGNISELQKILI